MTTEATSSATLFAGLVPATKATASEVVDAGKQGIAQSRQSLINSFLQGSPSSTVATPDFSKLVYENSFLSSVVSSNGAVTTSGTGKKISTFPTPKEALDAGLAAQVDAAISLLQSSNTKSSTNLSKQILASSYVKAGVVPDYSSSDDELSQIISGAMYAKDGVVLSDTPEAGSQFEYVA